MVGRLRWVLPAVMVAAVGTAGGAVLLRPGDLTAVAPWVPIALTALVAVATSATVRIRLRSAVVASSWTDAVIVVGVALGQPGWLAATIGLGVLAGKLWSKVPPVRAGYNAAKDSLAATVGVLVGSALGVAGTAEPTNHLAALALVACAVGATELAIGVPVLALATGTRWREVLAAQGEHLAISALAKFGVAALTVAVADQLPPGALLGVPILALGLHLIYARRVRAAAERAAWQGLAAATDQLNDTRLEVVLAAGVTHAAQLFSADEVEIVLFGTPGGDVLVRGEAAGVTWSGPPREAPPHGYGPRHGADGIRLALVGRDGRTDAGELRLRFRQPVTLSERERWTLRTFVAALTTAARTAAAFAETSRLELARKYAAHHDALTGLPNRNRLREYGTALLTAGVPGRLALVILDLDDFKEVNETLGHLAGDRLLVEICRRLARLARGRDLVARLGGDEFAVLLTGLANGPEGEEEARLRARELVAALDPAVDLGDARVRVDASAGYALVDTDLHEALRRADVAVYQAKRGGGRIVGYDPDRDPADVRRLSLGGDLPRAVAENEFTVLFQPIVDLVTGQMISAEALTRWSHPDRGELDPGRFLAAVERSGQLAGFAEAVLDQALAAQARWRSLGLTGPVAVNASPRSLLDPAFPRLVMNRLTAHRAGPEQLIIELTETLSMEQITLADGVLRALREAGVRLALDDFGTGNSALAMIPRIRPSELKIDRSFVSAMAGSPEAAAVVRSTVELANRLDLLVVAEGVESEQDRQALAGLGCGAGQGHLFARALPIDVLIDRLRAGPLAGPLNVVRLRPDAGTADEAIGALDAAR